MVLNETMFFPFKITAQELERKHIWIDPHPATVKKGLAIWFYSTQIGSGIRCLFDQWGMRDPHPGSHFRELRNNFLC